MYLPDELDIRDINMPGTHDTMSMHDYYLLGSVKTQHYTLKQQLDMGVRHLDIRLECDDGVLYSFHGAVYEKANFDDILHLIRLHLGDHPSEFITLWIIEENEPTNCAPFNEVLQSYMDRYAEIFNYPADIATFALKDWRGKVGIF